MIRIDLEGLICTATVLSIEMNLFSEKKNEFSDNAESDKNINPEYHNFAAKIFYTTALLNHLIRTFTMFYHEREQKKKVSK